MTLSTTFGFGRLLVPRVSLCGVPGLWRQGMNLRDLVNGLFELGGGILLWKNCHRLYVDKQVVGNDNHGARSSALSA